MARRSSVLSAYNPEVMWVLIGLNVAVYVMWQYLGNSRSGLIWLNENFLVSWPHLASGRVWTLLTSEFSHSDPQHLLFNMIALWVFGSAVHQVVKDVLFIHLYVVGAVLASLAHVAYGAALGSAVPALGASGAVMGIAVVYACLFPRNKLLIMFFLPAPAWLAVAGFIALDLFGVLSPVSDGVAHMAHLGGAAYGAAFYYFWLRKRVVRGPWKRWN